MKKVVLITGTRFWRSGAGVWARIAALVNYLSARCELTIIFTHAIRPEVLGRLHTAAGSASSRSTTPAARSRRL
jgi:hypothetical protein